MSPDTYESELTAGRDGIAAALTGVVDGILAGSIRLGDEGDAVVVDLPEELSLEIELEAEDGETSLELELEWPSRDGPSTDSPATLRPDEEESESTLVGATDASESLARFEVFRDRSDEWRWRLRHRNGNIIATSGEGYTRKHNAWKGLRSVIANSPEAEVVEDSTT